MLMRGLEWKAKYVAGSLRETPADVLCTVCPGELRVRSAPSGASGAGRDAGLNETFGKTLVTGIWQTYRIARSGGNSPTAAGELCELA